MLLEAGTLRTGPHSIALAVAPRSPSAVYEPMKTLPVYRGMRQLEPFPNLYAEA